MQVDFEIEYDDEEEDPLIDLELEEMGLVSTEIFKSAQGLSFEEMSQAIDIIQQVNKSFNDEEERQTVQTISKMKQTALFDIMIEQLDGGRQRVAEMMSKYDKGLVNDDSESASANELEEFDLDSYL